MRLLLGLERSTSGTATVNGKAYAEHRAPLREIGALPEAKAAHPARSARDHLKSLAYTHGLAARRVDEVLGVVGLSDVAGKRLGSFSLGMGPVAPPAGERVAGTSPPTPPARPCKGRRSPPSSSASSASW